MSDREKMCKMLKNFDGTFEDFIFLYVKNNRDEFPNKRIENITKTLTRELKENE